jgi:predicted nucleotidyltransferase
MSHGLPAPVIDRIQQVLDRHPAVHRAVLYGSRAKRCHRDGSDIDLTLQGGQLDDRALNRIANELDDLLLPWQFDLCHFDRLTHLELVAHIQRVGVILYEREAMRVAA